MIVYTPHITSRINYIIGYFNEKLGLQAEATNDEQVFRKHPSAKINYSAQRIDANEFFIKSNGILNEDEIKKQQVHCFEWKNTKAFFKTDDDIGFDIFSAVFYLLSRYEEYTEHEPDEYGRYAHWTSLASKNNFLMKPVVDIWLAEFKKLLQVKFADFKFQSSNFKFIPTYDIDIAWSYKNKGFWRNIGSSIQHPSTVSQRMKVIAGKEKDPFDSYNWLEKLHEENQLNALYFFLVAEERGGLDKNISTKKKEFRELIVQISKQAEVGVHPSVYSNTAKEYLLKEKQRLEQIVKKHILKSRYHYLLFHVPHSYRELIDAGITDDYTMGYGTVNGFRASTSNSFLWYDLEREETTTLRIHPFAFMEANSFYELHQSPTEALQELKQLHKEVKNINGTFMTIFHNHFLGTEKMFNGWKEMYNGFVSEMNFSNSVNE